MFFKKAKENGTNDWWQYMLTIIFTIVGMLLGSIPFAVLVSIAFRQKAPSSPQNLEEAISKMDFRGMDIDPNLILVLILLQFVLGMGFLYIFVRSLHKKRFSFLITPKRAINWSKIFYAFGIWFVILLFTEVISYFVTPETYQWNFQPVRFFTLLVVSLLILPIQTSFEEIFLRGYLMQGLGLLSRNRWIPILITSIIFASLHLANPEIQAFGMYKMIAYYFLIGLVFAIITVMDDSLEIPLGFHAANNIFGATIISFEGSALQTPALIHNTSVNTDGMLSSTFILLGILLIVAKNQLHWGPWNKLWSKIDFSKEEIV